MREAVIVSAVRTAVGKAPRGGLRSTRPDDMAAVVIREALNRAAPLEADQVVVRVNQGTVARPGFIRLEQPLCHIFLCHVWPLLSGDSGERGLSGSCAR